jgi:arabinan endo-1,5-alpha-L-arabinosidase
LTVAALAVYGYAGEPHLFRVTGDLERVHDPVIMREGDTYYVFSTNRAPRGHLPIRCSKDLLNWTLCGAVFETLPDWSTKEIPGARSFWAPDISHFNGKYHLYYSVSTFGKNRSAIGLVTNKTLDPSRPEYRWEDQGPVIQSYAEDPYNAIDPNLIVDRKGGAWLSFGSFWSGLKLRRIDRNTGKLSSEDQTLYSIAAREKAPGAPGGPIEAPFIFWKDGYYYLFASYDFCCRGAKSTYNIRVGRAREITGPYLDKEGKSMLEGGGTAVLAGNEFRKGPGHCGLLRDGKRDLMVFHAYDAKTGRSWLQLSTVVWDRGWPRVAALPNEPFGSSATSPATE